MKFRGRCVGLASGGGNACEGGCPAAVELEFRTVSSTNQSRIRREKNCLILLWTS